MGSGDLFKAIMRKAKDMKEDEDAISKPKQETVQMTQELTVEEEDEDHAQIESDEIHYERIGESTLVLFVEVDNFDPEAVSAKWYKDGKLVEDCSDTEYHTGDSNNVSAQSSNSIVAISLYVANYQAAEGQWSLTIDDGVASQTIGLNLT